jgi:hypothetical protein
MQLKYRGVPYEYTPPAVTSVDTGITATYRGIPYKLQNLVTEPIPQPALSLKYRGIPYQIGGTLTDGVEQPIPLNSKALTSIAEAIIQAQLLWLNIQLHRPTENH